MRQPINLDSLGQLDGGAARAIIDAAIRDAVRDIDDRGGDGKPRKVEIILTLSVLDNNQVACHVEAAAKVPRRRTAGTIGAIHSKSGQPQLMFNDLAEDPEQRTLDELDPS